MVRWLPKRVTSLPETGIIRSCPTGSAKRIDPNCPSLRWSAVLISGIRLAQDAKQRPMQKYVRATAILILLFSGARSPGPNRIFLISAELVNQVNSEYKNIKNRDKGQMDEILKFLLVL
jgi:hypothetical protein